MVVQQTSLPVGDLPVEAMQADRIESEPPQVRDLVADDLLVVEPAPARLDVFVVERRVVVDAEDRDLARVIRPAQHALPVMHGRAVGRSHRQRGRESEQDKVHRPRLT